MAGRFLQSWVDSWSVVSRMGEERSVLLTIFQCFRDKDIPLDLRLTSMATRAYNHCPIVRVRYGGGLAIGPRDLMHAAAGPEVPRDLVIHSERCAGLIQQT
jgi:hypothetical protein